MKTISSEMTSLTPSMARIQIATFNMQFGQLWREDDPDGAPVEVARSVALLRELDADILLLQEVEHAAQAPAADDPTSNFSAIRRAMPDYDAYCVFPISDEPQLPFGLGLAILSRTPLGHRTNLDLPGPPITFEFENKPTRPGPRTFMGARTTVGGREIQIFNTHLQAFFMIGSSSDEHTTQRDIVAEQLIASRLPTVFGGDLNCAPSESTIEQFEAIGYRAAQKTKPTWHRRPYVCDHLFVNDGLFLTHARVVPTTASDHMPVVACFEI
jgi:endonuclease/exonuclease/phosphatase family metal-dependent hydrolase